MKVLLLLGWGFGLVVAAGGEDQLDTAQSDVPLSETDAPGQPTTHPSTHQDNPTSAATTSPTAAEEFITSSSLRTTADTIPTSPDLREEQVTQTVPSLVSEAESSVSHEVSSTVTPATIPTTASISTAVVSTLTPPHSAPDTETTGVPETSPTSTTQPLGTNTPTTISLAAEDGVEFHSSPSATVTMPPDASTQSGTEQEESTATQSTINTTTTTTTTTTDTPATENTVAPSDTTDATTTTTTTDSTYYDTTSEGSFLGVTAMANATSQSSGVCFGKTEVNTLVVVAVVVAVNVVSVVMTALCVHRLVSRRLSWDPPPIYRHRSTRSEKGEKRARGPAGRNLASDTECKAGEGGGQTSTQIPILITNEDGWCVPYSNEAQEGKKKREKEVGAATEDTGV